MKFQFTRVFFLLFMFVFSLPIFFIGAEMPTKQRIFRLGDGCWLPNCRDPVTHSPQEITAQKAPCKVLATAFSRGFNSAGVGSSCALPVIGDNFDVSLGGSQVPLSFLESPWTSQNFPELLQKFPSDFPQNFSRCGI